MTREQTIALAINQARDLLVTLIGPPDGKLTGDVAKTPERFVKGLVELIDPSPCKFDFTTFESDSDEMVVVSDIPFVTLCAHHVLPFTGVAHVGYVPNGRIAGLSKLARTVTYYSKGLNVQETLGQQIADHLEAHLKPLGVAVILEAEHTCMTIRGIKANGSRTTTSVMRGCFADHNRLARQEFLSIVKK